MLQAFYGTNRERRRAASFKTPPLVSSAGWRASSSLESYRRMDKRYFHQRDKKSMRSEASGDGVGRGLLWEIAYHEERRNSVDQWRAVSQRRRERYVNVRHKDG